MTPEQFTANRAAAVDAVRTKLGLAGKAPSDWTYEERTAYLKALAEFIATRPEQFGAVDAANAGRVLQADFRPLEDTGFDWGLFATEAVAPLADAAQGVGEGVLSVGRAMRWALPVLAVVAVVVIAEKLSGGTAISSLKKVFK